MITLKRCNTVAVDLLIQVITLNKGRIAIVNLLIEAITPVGKTSP
jgi:hypothetical protein